MDKTVEEVFEESDEEIQTPVKSKREFKPRPPKTPAQIEAFKRAIAIRNENVKKRKEEAEKIVAEAKDETEKKIVRKAIEIKKKQIKKQLALEDISDDEDSIEVVKAKVKKVIAKPTPKPTFTFV
jgi:hypothetical protein